MTSGSSNTDRRRAAVDRFADRRHGVAAPRSPRRPPTADTLDAGRARPLKRNLGTYLESGTLLCLVGDPARFEAVLHVTNSDIELVQIGQPVRIMLDHLPSQMFAGTVSRLPNSI